MKKKPTKKIAPQPAVAPEPLRLRREAMFTAVDEVHDALGEWLHTDLTIGDRRHDFSRGEYLARQLHQLVEMLIAEVKDVQHAINIDSEGAV